MKYAITLCSNNNYIIRAINLIQQIKTIGKWNHDIIFFYDNELDKQYIDLLQRFNIIIKEFPKIDVSVPQKILNRATMLDYPARDKTFQYHKFYTFDTYFKQWDRILYIDCGIHIYGPLQRMFNIDPGQTLMAHNNNTYPILTWKLNHEFELRNETNIVNTLYQNFGTELDNLYSFQSTIMLYNTSIIENNMVDDLIYLMNKYPISKANDQGIFNLYFVAIKKIWKQIPTYDCDGFLYDFLERDNNNYTNYLMLKDPKTDPNRYW